MPQLNNSPINRDLLDGLEAYLDSLEGDPAAALEKIAGKKDPDNVRRRIAILIDSERIEDAAIEARSHEYSEVWMDLAIFSLAAIGADAEAKERLNWTRALPKALYWQRSAIAYFDGAMHWVLRNSDGREAFTPATVSSDERDHIRNIAATLDAVCAPTLVGGRLDTELEVQMLCRLLDASFLVQAREKCREIVKILERRHPIPLRVAQAVVQDIADPVENLVDRLWTEHGDLFTARLLACVIQANIFEDEVGALNRAYVIVESAKSSDEKEKVCQLLCDLTDPSDPIALTRLTETATALLGAGSRILTFLAADDALRKGDTTTALLMVGTPALANDPHAMRLKAIANLKAEKPLEALKILQDLARGAPSPWVFKMIGDVARKHDRENDELDALEHMVTLAPSDRYSRQRLSWLYTRHRDYKHAVPHLEALHQQAPDDVEVTINLAVVYSFDGQHARALTVLADASTGKAPSLLIVKAQAQILQSLGRSLDAFNALDAIRGEFWEDPQFLSAYMAAGHAADKEQQAHEALEKLLTLKQKGLVDDHLIRAASLDELKDMLTGAAKRDKSIKRFIIEGKFPWLLGAEMEREAIYWSWSLRTQSAQWLVDDALNRAAYSIYATNGFRVLDKPNEAVILTEIECAPRGHKVVADMSALITLHSLGLLERAAEYFGNVLVPASYLPKIISDMRMLFPHQLSQKRAAEQIKAAVDMRDISVRAVDSAKQWVGILDEYQDENDANEPLYRLCDLLETLHAQGLVTDEQRDRAKLMAHKKAEASQKQGPLQLGDGICIAGDTLGTLASAHLLDHVTKHFSVYITQQDYDSVLSRIRAFQALDSVQKKHKSLWDLVQSNIRFEFATATEVLDISDDEQPDRDIATAAYLLAKEKDIPLLVDDRVCQTLLLNEWKQTQIVAFGTDSLVHEMAKVGIVTRDEAADALLQLLNWRYRFILVPPDILKLLADRYRSHPPGAALRKIAIYVHDCMRDEGLFGGFETTDPPISMAMRLYQNWIQNVAEFVMDIWLDDQVDESSAREVTTWAITDLLPSPPHILDERVQSNMALLTPRTAITRALIRSTRGGNADRINSGLQAMSDGFGLSDAEYLKIITGVVSGI